MQTSRVFQYNRQGDVKMLPLKNKFRLPTSYKILF